MRSDPWLPPASMSYKQNPVAPDELVGVLQKLCSLFEWDNEVRSHSEHPKG